MKINFKTNIIYNLLYQIISILLPLLTAPYVSRVLGATGIGNISYTQAIFIYFNLFAAMGTGTYAQRMVASDRCSIVELTKSFWEIVILKASLAVIGILLFVFFIVGNGGPFKLLFAVQIVDLSVNIVDIAWLYQGLENFKKTVSRQVLIRIFGAVAVFIFVKRPEDTYKYLLCHSIPMLLGYAAMWIGVYKVVKKPKLKELHPYKHLPGVIALFIPYIATLLFSYIDRIMIGSMTNTMAEVGYYEQGNKFITISITIVTSLSTVLLPKIASLNKENNISLIKSYINKSVRFIFCMGGLLTVGLFVVGGNLIPWYFGVEFTNSIAVMKILSFMVIFKGMNNILGSGYLIASFQQRKYTVAIYVSAINNIVLNLIFIPWLNAMGAAITSVISEAVLFILMAVFSRKVFELSEIIREVWKYILAGILALLISGYIGNYLLPSVVNTILLTILITGLYGSLLLVLKDSFVVENIRIVSQKLSKTLNG